MKYCLHYNRENKYLSSADEIIIKYKDEPFNSYKDFFELYPQQTIIIDFQEKDFSDYTYLLLKQLKDEGISNFKILIDKSIFNNKIHNFLIENQIPFFFSSKVYDIDTLFEFIHIKGLSDIYITNILCFGLINISDICKSNNINIRICPNIVQSCARTINPLLTFFIRPEDIDHYALVVDVIEFWSENSIDEEVYYKVYAIDKQWFGPLSEIIHNFSSDINNTRILPEFGTRRLNCWKRCLTKGNCHFCYKTVPSVANYLDKENQYFNIEKEIPIDYEPKFKHSFKENETNTNE